MNLQELTQRIETEKPKLIYVGDAHCCKEPQIFARDFIIELAKREINFGAYLEALYSVSDVYSGDYRGGVINWDSTGNTCYRRLIDSVKDKAPVHGIDAFFRDSRSGERMEYWRDRILDGKEQTKVIFAGVGHLFNNRKESADIITLINPDFWIIDSAAAYVVPKPIETLDVNYKSIDKPDYKAYIYGKRQNLDENPLTNTKRP
jgi:hypothetical protein